MSKQKTTMTQFYRLCQKATSFKDLVNLTGMTPSAVSTKRTACKQFAQAWDLPWASFEKSDKKDPEIELQEIAELKGMTLRGLKIAIARGKYPRSLLPTV